MKKVLFATTALIATAGMAAADIKLSGYGRFGALYNDVTDDTNFVSRLRIQIDVSAETQSGVKFGARQRIQTEENGMGAGNGVRFYMTTGGLTVAGGNILGVIEAMPGLYLNTKSAGVGLEGNGFDSLVTNTSGAGYFGWDAYSSGGVGATNGVEVIYSANGFTVHASSSDNSDALGVSYKFGDYTVAVAGQDSTILGDKTVVTVGGKLGAADFTLAYADNDGVEKWAIKGGANVGAATYVYGFVSSEDLGEAYGLGVSHDLGGASIEAGVTQNDILDRTLVSAGFFFAF
ncbi:outer membrane protein OmpU [Thalassovita litoralis]|jgi:outer membrane protein OmpU|uniref:Outer membrane protein OmpU n=1 Tax=Thalassovita litoralis TaxID=1010611 RepID=A0A521AP96_9RHOB|nr:porin [Thalassovita litoralis]SMO36625.1 outer membrane protein OmpU [Thalassovita litoralis]